MKRFVGVGLVSMLTSLLLVTGAMAKGEPAKGKASYDQMCASCHGAAGKGDGAAAAALNPKPKDLSDKKYGLFRFSGGSF